MSLECWHRGWENRVGGATATNELAHFDCSRDYEMDVIHVFALSDGTYAYVSETGCSCYESNDAELELLPLARAIDKYRDYKQANNGVFTNLELLEIKSIEKEEKANEPRCKNCNS